MTFNKHQETWCKFCKKITTFGPCTNVSCVGKMDEKRQKILQSIKDYKKDMTTTGKWDVNAKQIIPLFWPEEETMSTNKAVTQPIAETTVVSNEVESKKDLEAYVALIETFKKMAVVFEDGKKKAGKIVGLYEPQTLNEWCDESHGVSKSKGWYDGGDADNFPTKLALIHSEVSEVLEEYRNGKGMTEVYYKDGKPEGIPIEIADILIRVFDVCGYNKIDIEEAVRVKTAYNKTRPHRHGGKKI